MVEENEGQIPQDEQQPNKQGKSKFPDSDNSVRENMSPHPEVDTSPHQRVVTRPDGMATVWDDPMSVKVPSSTDKSPLDELASQVGKSLVDKALSGQSTEPILTHKRLL